MSADFSDPTVRRIIKIYQSYHHAIHTRALREGRSYILRALVAVLIHEGLKTQVVDRIPDEPDSGHLLVDDMVTVYIACIPKIDPQADPWGAINSNSGIQTTRLILNFGSDEPDFYPKPLDETEQMERCWEEAIDPEEDEESEADDVP